MTDAATNDPEIEIFDVSSHAGMECYAADSVNRLAPYYRRLAREAKSEEECADLVRHAEAHEELARQYRFADHVLEEIEWALEEEAQCESS